MRVQSNHKDSYKKVGGRVGVRDRDVIEEAEIGAMWYPEPRNASSL